MKIVLANSVGIGEKGERYVHFPSRWTAVESPSWYDHRKGWMTFYPFMLAYCSALLKRDTPHAVKFLDGNLNNWDHAQYLEKIAAERPGLLVMDTSTLAFEMDMKLALAAKRATGCKVVFAGQHPSAFPRETLAAGADYVCLGEYEMTVKELALAADPRTVAGLYPNPRRELTDPNKLPWPEDEDVRRMDYIEPVVNEYRELEMFASRGCPLACSFCVASNVYYGGAGTWRPRDVEDVADEIAAMKARYPEMEGVFFDDEAHNGRADFVVALCKAIIARKLDGLKYNAMCGYWNLDREVLGWMKKAGYYKIRVGIETADKDVARAMHKTHSMKKLYAALEAAAAAGLRVYGTFTYGAPGSNPEKDRATTALLKDLLEKRLLHDCQISICTPQPGTPFYAAAESCGHLPKTAWSGFDGGRNVIQSYPDYPAARIGEVVAEARRVAANAAGGARFRDADFSSIARLVPARGKTLLICSGPRWQTRAVLQSLQGTSVDLLIRPDGSDWQGRRVIPFGEGGLTPETLPAESARAVAEGGYRFAIVQVNHNCEDVSDYTGVFRVAETAKCPWAAVNIRGEVLEKNAIAAGRP